MASRGYKFRRAFFRILLIVAIGFALYFIIKPLAVIDLRIANLQDENARLKAEKRRIENDLLKLDSDIEIGKTLAGYEQQARERLQMIYEGEQIFICKDSEGFDLRPDNERNEVLGIPEKTVFQKIWNMVLNLFR